MPNALTLFVLAALFSAADFAFAGVPLSDRTRIEINLGRQILIYYRGRDAVLQTGISTGKPGFETPTGSYAVSDKCLSRCSSIYHVQMPFFLRLSGSPYGIHYGYNPGYAASHGCIRVATAHAAEELYDLVPIGTPVQIRRGDRVTTAARQAPAQSTTVPTPTRISFWTRLFSGSAHR